MSASAKVAVAHDPFQTHVGLSLLCGGDRCWTFDEYTTPKPRYGIIVSTSFSHRSRHDGAHNFAGQLRAASRTLVALLFLFDLGNCSRAAADEVHLAMGMRVGEVTQSSAIIWSRVTKDATRNESGRRLIGRAGARVPKYEPLPFPVDELQGAVPGARGELRFTWSQDAEFREAQDSGWLAVDSENDYIRQHQLTDLEPATRYYVRVEARPVGAERATARIDGSFITAALSDAWQDVRFTVVTGQAYHDLDDPAGFKIYDAMLADDPQFIVPTGDTVYYDSEQPRARTIDLARHHWHRMYSLPRLVEFHRYVPGYWEKDDHDTLSNDGWSTLEPAWMLPLTWEDGLRIFREQVPIGDEPYRTIRWGSGLQIWVVEGRDFRSPNTDPDGPDKSIWGTEQREWLQRTILESDAAFRVLISPTPIVGPDRANKQDNHANEAFTYEGNAFRRWTQEQGLTNFFICCGDRHWQYMSVDPDTRLREFSCGPVCDEHAGGTPGHDMQKQPYHRVIGGYLSVAVTREDERPTITFRFHDVSGDVTYEYRQQGER